MSSRPVVLVPACHRDIDGHPFHVVGRKYIEAVRLAGGLPLVVPWAAPEELEQLLSQAHGVLLTGSPSNVHPSHFDQPVHDPALPLDPDRDRWTLPLVRRVVQTGMPLFGICRGFQEVNVALGGSLHQAVHEQPGHHDHRDAPEAPAEVAYGPAHTVEAVAGGLLERVTGLSRFEVNSLHGQGVDRLAPGLQIAALAPEGLIAAFSLPEPAGFALCVQWHPEWQAAGNPVSLRMLQAFGAACERFRTRQKENTP